MSIEQLIKEAMLLPVPERLSLAQALWDSIAPGAFETDDHSAVQEAVRRGEELSSGAVAGCSHEEVMLAVRHAIASA